MAATCSAVCHGSLAGASDAPARSPSGTAGPAYRPTRKRDRIPAQLRCHGSQRPTQRRHRALSQPYDDPGRHGLGSLLAVGATRAFPAPRMCRQRLRRPAPRRPAAPGRPTHVAFVAEQPEKRRSGTRGEQQMPATLKLTHEAIGAEVRRGPYDVVVDGERVGSVEMNHTIEISVEPGRHTLQVRNGRNSSSTQTFDAAEEEIVAFRCTGKRFLPIFLASFVVPRLALKLVRD